MISDPSKLTNHCFWFWQLIIFIYSFFWGFLYVAAVLCKHNGVDDVYKGVKGSDQYDNKAIWLAQLRWHFM